MIHLVNDGPRLLRTGRAAHVGDLRFERPATYRRSKRLPDLRPAAPSEGH